METFRRSLKNGIRDTSQVTTSMDVLIGVFTAIIVGGAFSLLHSVWPYFQDRASAYFSPLGFVYHLIYCGFVGWCYARLFRSAHRSGINVGAQLGFMHWMIAGILLTFLPLLQPAELNPYVFIGAFGLHMGLGTVLWLLFFHLAFGAVYGWLYDLAAIRKFE